MTYLGAALKRRLYPTVLCYHGCVSRRDQVLVFREALADVKAHVRTMQAAGYRIVKPSEYRAWRLGTLSFDEPVTCIHFDDGLASIELVVPWLIEQGIPCGLALITRRLGVRDPEDGFLTWARIAEWVATGLVEILSHTHNLHHLTLLPQPGGGVDVGPVLEGPCWIDDGDVVYRETADSRWYWDFSHVDLITLGVPLWGTDPYDETTKIVTTVRITPKATGTVTLLRLWMALSKPSGAGYDAQVQLRVDGVLVFDGVISPKQYETRAQWVEREFYTLNLDTPFSVTAGVAIEMEWKTLNQGPGVALIYGLTTHDDSAFRATTNCQGLYRAGSQGAPDKFWQYIDYPAGDRWPVKACIILAFGTGRAATDTEYGDYIAADCAAFNAAVTTLPQAVWAERAVFDAGGDVRKYVPVGWNAPAKQRAVIRLTSATSIEMRYLRIEVGPPEFFTGGDADPFGTPLARVNPVGFEAVLQETGSRSYPATFKCYVATPEMVARPPQLPYSTEYVDLQMQPDEELLGIVSVTDEEANTYRPIASIPYNPVGGLREPFPAFTYYHLLGERRIMVSQEGYGRLITITVSVVRVSPGAQIGQAAIWRISRGQAQEVDPTTIGPDATKYLVLDPINGGPTVGPEQRVRWGVTRVLAGYQAGTNGVTAPTVNQIVYPFGSYYADGVGAIAVRPGFQDIRPGLASTFSGAGLDHGYTIQAYRNLQASEAREPALRRTQWALGRWLIYGDQAPDVARNNLAAYSGMLFRDVPHRGVDWQVSLEADPLGNATVRARPQVLDFVAFDAYGFDGAGGIERQALNDGGVYEGTAYANDKAWLQARGVRCLLIINNNMGTGEPDADIGSHVVNNPGVYVPLIVAIAVDDGWDGITCNLEAVPAADRAAATTFYRQLARALHAAGKLLHATVPAPTGTDYDADWWVGWCDHGELAKVCDRIKVMSYTETGPGTDPGPAAPDWFWAAVYARIRRVVPEPFWPRVLVGCRAFGHLWTAGVTDDAEYISYHKGIADALTYGKRIDVRDTEAGWSNGTYTAWFGTPETVDRAQREAAQSFGGIGLWKADDGDIEEFFPLTRQIGKDEDMSFMDVRFPVTVSRGSSGGPVFSTAVVETQSGDSARNARWAMPLHRYDASLAVRRQADWDEIRALFMAARGRWKSFRFKDWADYRATAAPIGTADGVLTNFQLAKTYTYDGQTFVRTITKPVAGSVRVYRNAVEVVSGWTVNTGTGLVSFAVAPAAGAMTADFEFDVPVRFDVDSLPAEGLARKQNGELIFDAGTVPLVEVRA